MCFDEEQGRKPCILVIAGPNGSGKSTVTKGFPVVGIYVNADEIKKSAGCTDLEAAREAEVIRRALVAAGQDFTFETVLSTERNLNLLAEAKSAGYRICAVFVLTKDSAINVRRVRERVLAGGHNVPENKIISRYTGSMRNLAKLVRIADLTRIIDNSTETPSMICEVAEGKAVIWENSLWSTLEILRLLQLD
ncbi:MAG: zeta toxin family protein [Eubacteriales bacterium]|nr:zeta toxin family protein [Eubacteriales bacterium]